MSEPTEREWVERCVATLVFYEKDCGSLAAKQLLDEQADALLAWSKHTREESQISTSVLLPLEGELLRRFSPEISTGLCKKLAIALTRPRVKS